ncbi:IS3 family transposase [Brevibacillus fortis]|uniref:IS3 family transposase n=1 Tax=Brevibacillus fortis TaxID=2126352 RepID=UPI0038FCD59C
MESFFGHMKDDLDYKECRTIHELRDQIDDFITYYNSGLYQWSLKKMTPDEFRSHLLVT